MDALATVTYPGTKKNLVESEMVADNLRIDGMKVSFSLIFPRDTRPLYEVYHQGCRGCHTLSCKQGR